MVEYLADALRAEPVLCLVTARPDGNARELIDRIERHDPAAVIRLDGLPDAEVDRMVAACLDVATAPDDLVAFVRRHSDGSPFLVEELLAGLVSSGELRLEDGQWTRVGDADAHRAGQPARVRSTAASARSIPTARRVLGAAALLGRSFDWELLPGIAEVDGKAAVDGLRAAVDQQLIEVDGVGFRFRHALTREAVLHDLLPPERRDLASRAWPAHERANPGLPGATLELAADLAEAAGEPRTAARHLAESARRARDNGALISAEADGPPGGPAGGR